MTGDDQDETQLGIAADAPTEFRDPVPLELQQAWSVDDDHDEPEAGRASWRRAGAIGGAIAIAAAAAAGGIFAWAEYSKPVVEVQSTAEPPAKVVESPPPSWHLDGTYRIDIRNPEGTERSFSGVVTSMGESSDVPTATKWVAYETECERSECTARSILLDNVTHQNAALTDESGDENGVKTATLRWNGTEWVSVGGPGPHGGLVVEIGCAANRPGLNTWEVWQTLSPLPDGSFRGTSHRNSLIDQCGGDIARMEVPVTVVRLGDAPAGIFHP